MPNADDFRNELLAQFSRASRQGRTHIEINAGEMHRLLGGYPPKNGKNHSMPSCCLVMRQELEKGEAVVVHETGSGHAPSLTIRYKLPR